VLNGGFYGETFIPERYAREAFSEHLDFVEFFEDGGHPILFFQR